MSTVRLLARHLSARRAREDDVRMPDWIVARLAAVYAVAGAAIMARGGQTLCDQGRVDRGADSGWCQVFVRDEQWLVLVLGPALAAMLVVVALPRGRDRRFRAWFALAVAHVIFVCVGAST